MKKIFFISMIVLILCFVAYITGYNTATTTTNLSLVKPAEDDDDYNWFNTVNDNWDLIDAAFSELTTYLTDLDKESELETQLSDVTDVFTNNDTIDISDYTNLAGTANEITLTDDTLSIHADITRDTEWDTHAELAAILNIGITDDHLLEVDDAAAADNEYARFTANGIEGVAKADLITDLALDSDDLTDVSSIAMLDEAENITSLWAAFVPFTMYRKSNTYFPQLVFERLREDPDNEVVSGDVIGELYFRGYTGAGGMEPAVKIRAIADGTPGENDMPGRLEFLTTPDGSDTSSLRMAIDNAGNFKHGDGVWTNYVNITNAGVLSLEGSAYQDMNNNPVKEVETVQFNGVYDNGNSGASCTIDWQNGQYQKVAISENTTLSFSNAFVGSIHIRMTYSGAYTVDFNGAYTIEEEGGTEIVFTETNAAVDELSVRYWGTADTYTVGALLDVKD